MKIMLDANVLISALIFGGTPKQLIGQLLLMGHDIYISDYVENEFLDKIHLKWPQKEDDLRRVYQKMNFVHCPSTEEKLGEVRDKKDIPVLSDALYNNVDLLYFTIKSTVHQYINIAFFLRCALCIRTKQDSPLDVTVLEYGRFSGTYQSMVRNRIKISISIRVVCFWHMLFYGICLFDVPLIQSPL